MFNKYRTEIILFSSVLILRLLFLAVFYPAFGAPEFLAGDGIDFFVGAQNLRDFGVFSIDTAPPLRPAISYTPGYSVFMLLASFGTLNLPAILVVQHIIGALGAVLVFWLGLLLFERLEVRFPAGSQSEAEVRLPAGSRTSVNSKRAGLLAGLLFGLEPGIVFFSSQLFSEALFTTLFLAALYLIIKSTLHLEVSLPSGLFWSFAGAGALLGMAAYARASMIYVAPLVILFLILLYILKRRNGIVLLKSGAIFTITFVLLIAPWIIRNYYYHGYAEFSSLGGYVLATRNIPSYFAYKENVPIAEAQQEAENYFVSKGISKEVFKDFESNYDPRLQKESMKIILKNPLSFTASQTKFLVPYFFGTGWSEIVKVFAGNKQNPPDFHENLDAGVLKKIKAEGGILAAGATVAGAAFFGLLYVLSLLGLYGLFKNVGRRTSVKAVAVFFLVLILFFAFSTGPLSYSRYRFPVNPLIFLLASAGLFTLKHQRKNLTYQKK